MDYVLKSEICKNMDYMEIETPSMILKMSGNLLLCYQSEFGIFKNNGNWKPQERYIIENKSKENEQLCKKCIENGNCFNGNNWNGVLFNENEGGLLQVEADILGNTLVIHWQ
uniref:Apple domain-containing protein n=1 Tax=Meloidogyne hapla TaxID=6305 RepID=A0A1I8BVU8_MELHA